MSVSSTKNAFGSSSATTENALPTIVRYMPDVNIKFNVKGMKPFTKLYAFFGNRDVTNKIVVNSPSTIPETPAFRK